MSTPRKSHAKTLQILVSGKFNISDNEIHVNKPVAWSYDGTTITATETGDNQSNVFTLDEDRAYIKRVNYIHGAEPKAFFSRKVVMDKIIEDTFETQCPGCSKFIIVKKSSANMVNCENCNTGFPLSRGKIYGEKKDKKTFVPKERFDHDDIEYNQMLSEKAK